MNWKVFVVHHSSFILRFYERNSHGDNGHSAGDAHEDRAVLHFRIPGHFSLHLRWNFCPRQSRRCDLSVWPRADAERDGQRILGAGNASRDAAGARVTAAISPGAHRVVHHRQQQPAGQLLAPASGGGPAGLLRHNDFSHAAQDRSPAPVVPDHRGHVCIRGLRPHPRQHRQYHAGSPALQQPGVDEPAVSFRSHRAAAYAAQMASERGRLFAGHLPGVRPSRTSCQARSPFPAIGRKSRCCLFRPLRSADRMEAVSLGEGGTNPGKKQNLGLALVIPYLLVGTWMYVYKNPKAAWASNYSMLDRPSSAPRSDPKKAGTGPSETPPCRPESPEGKK